MQYPWDSNVIPNGGADFCIFPFSEYGGRTILRPGWPPSPEVFMIFHFGYLESQSGYGNMLYGIYYKAVNNTLYCYMKKENSSSHLFSADNLIWQGAPV